MEKKKITPQHLSTLQASSFMDDDLIRDRFIFLASNVNKGEDAEEYYQQQANYFKRALADSADLRSCTIFSLYNCFIDIPLLGMTLDKNANLLYFDIRGHFLGFDDKGNKVYENRASLKITPYGELAMRIELNQIKYIDNPVVCYEGDKVRISIGDDGKKKINYEANIPRQRGKIIFGFVKVTRPDNSYDYHWMEEDDIKRLEQYSLRNNKQSKKANALYGAENAGIDKGFFEAKLIKHAFRAFPKFKVKGTNSSLEGDGTDTKNVFLNEATTGEPAVENVQDAVAPAQQLEPKIQVNNPEPEPVIQKKSVRFEDDDF